MSPLHVFPLSSLSIFLWFRDLPAHPQEKDNAGTGLLRDGQKDGWRKWPLPLKMRFFYQYCWDCLTRARDEMSMLQCTRVQRMSTQNCNQEGSSVCVCVCVCVCPLSLLIAGYGT
ncbi:hypothetical protein FKM82_013037 [Ascaphus truei]